MRKGGKSHKTNIFQHKAIQPERNEMNVNYRNEDAENDNWGKSERKRWRNGLEINKGIGGRPPTSKQRPINEDYANDYVPKKRRKCGI